MAVTRRVAALSFDGFAHPIITWVLVASFVFAILTLWVPAYWPVSVFELLVFGLTASVLVQQRHRFWLGSYPLYIFLFAVGWGILQCLLGSTVYLFATEKSLLRWTTFLAVYAVGFFLFEDRSASRRFRVLMVWFGTIVAVEAVIQSFLSPGYIFGLFSSGYGDATEIMGPILYHTHYAAFVETILPIALYGALADKQRSRAYAVASAILYVSVIVSESRGGFILTTAEIVVVLVLFARRARAGKRVSRAGLLQMAGLIVAFLLVVGWGTMSARLQAANPMAGRREFAISTLHMIAARPWFGFGLGTWPTVYPQYAVIDLGHVFVNEAHSDWLQWGAEGGLPLLLAMASLLIWLIRPAFRSIWGIGVVVVFVHAFFDYPFSRPAIGAWTILVLAMIAAGQYTENIKEIAPSRDIVSTPEAAAHGF